MAGLGAYYQVDCHYYLHKTWHEELGAVLQLHVVDLGKGKEILEAPLPVPMDGPIDLAFTIDGKHLQFEIRLPGEGVQKIGPQLSSTILSDDYVFGFTGAFATLMCTDLSGQKTPAAFDHLLVSPQTTSEPSNQIRKQLSLS
jgi:beta-xylosidase